MKIPDASHPISITPEPMRMRVKAEGHVVADTAGALRLQEADYPPVFYFPPADVETGFLGKTERSTHCPYKGDASYWTLRIDGVIKEDAVWAYESPYPAVEAIGGYLAFYPDQVEVYAVDPAV